LSYPTNPPDEETPLFVYPRYSSEVLAASLYVWRLLSICVIGRRATSR
jgi:hypothetical protein